MVDIPGACSEHIVSFHLDHICSLIVGVRFELAHRYAIFLCSLDVEIYLTRPKKSSWATNYWMVDLGVTRIGGLIQISV